MFTELTQLQDDIMETTDKIKHMDIVNFGTYICMLIEEYYKANKLDATEMADTLCNLVKEVNEEEGRYE